MGDSWQSKISKWTSTPTVRIVVTPTQTTQMGEKETTMAQYSAERKQAILNKLLSPELISIAQLARDEHIAEQTL